MEDTSVKKFFLFFFLFCFISLLVINQTQATGIVADDPEEQIDTWSEKEIAKISRGSVRHKSAGLTKSDGVEYFGDAHQKSLLNGAKQAGYTPVEAQSLLDTALIEKKRIGGKRALSNFYAALDAKRASAGTGISLATIRAEILAEVDRKIAEAKKSGLDEGNKAIEALRAEMAGKLTQTGGGAPASSTIVGQVPTATANPTSTGTKTVEERLTSLEGQVNDPTTGLVALNTRVDSMDRAWEQTIQQTHEAIRQIDCKVKKVNAETKNLMVAETYLHSSNEKERQKGLGLLYLARNGQFRTKNAKDAQKYSTGLQLPNSVDNSIDVDKEVLPEEKKDSASTGQKSDCK